MAGAPRPPAALEPQRPPARWAVSAGGLGPTGKATAAVEGYDQIAQRWWAMPPLHAPRYQAAACGLADGRLVVCSGTDGGSWLRSCEVFDPPTNSWSTLRDEMPSARAARCCELRGSGGRSTILFVGGCTWPRAVLSLSSPTDPIWVCAAVAMPPVVDVKHSLAHCRYTDEIYEFVSNEETAHRGEALALLDKAELQVASEGPPDLWHTGAPLSPHSNLTPDSNGRAWTWRRSWRRWPQPHRGPAAPPGPAGCSGLPRMA